MNQFINILAGVCFIAAMPSGASVITGVTAFATSRFDGAHNESNLVDNSGLSAPDDTAATHGFDQSAFLQWHNTNADGNPEIIFDLGGSYNVSQIHIWNGNQWGGLDLTGRGVNQFDVLVSSDGSAFTEVLTDQTLAISAPNTQIAAQAFNLLGQNAVTHVKIRIDSNHGDPDGYIGLSEVKFTQVPQDPSILAANVMDFGYIAPSTIKQKSFTVQNTGALLDLEISSVAITGADNLLFTIVSSPTLIAPGSSGLILVNYAPGASDGYHSANLEIEHNTGGVLSTKTVSLKGGTNLIHSDFAILDFAVSYPGYGPEKLFDSKPDEFASFEAGAGAAFSKTEGTWIELDFGKVLAVDRMILISRLNNADLVGESRLILSNDPTFDSSDTIHIISATGENGQGLIHQFPVTNARYARWEVSSQLSFGSNLGGMELRFLEAVPGWYAATAFATGGSPPFDSYYYSLANAANGDAGSSDSDVYGYEDVEYVSDAAGDSMFVDFDLGSSLPIVGFDFFDRISLANRTTSFDLQFSNDSSFNTGVTTVSVVLGGDLWGVRRSLSGIPASRYIRFAATGAKSTFAYTGIQEIIFYSGIQPPPPPSPYARFINITWNLSGIDALPETDFDGDCMSNALEFAMRTNPTAFESGVVPLLDHAEGFYTFTFRRNRVVALSNFLAQYSSDLSDWTTAVDGQEGIEVYVIEDEIDSGLDTVVASIPESLVTEPKFFMRLEVTITP